MALTAQQSVWLGTHQGHFDSVETEINSKLADAGIGMMMVHRRRSIIAKLLTEHLAEIGDIFSPYLDGLLAEAPLDFEDEVQKSKAVAAVLDGAFVAAPQALLEMGLLAMLEGRNAEALRLLKILLSDLPGFMAAALTAGRLALEANDPNEALRIIGTVEVEARNTREGSELMADTLRALGRHSEASFYDRACLTNPVNRNIRGNECAPFDLLGRPVADPHMAVPSTIGWFDGGAVKNDRGLYYRTSAEHSETKFSDHLGPRSAVADHVHVLSLEERQILAREQFRGAVRRILEMRPARRGHKTIVGGPFVRHAAGWRSSVVKPLGWSGTELFMTIDGRVEGPVALNDDRFLDVGRSDLSLAEVEALEIHLVAAERWTLVGPFAHVEGLLWIGSIPELTPVADSIGHGNRSNVLAFEDGRPLGPRHAPHVEIAAQGGGRYSHWESSFYFSTRDGSDPNTNGRRYDLMVTSAADSSARRFALDGSTSSTLLQRVTWPFEKTSEGWIGFLPEPPYLPVGVQPFLIIDGKLKGPARVVPRDRVLLGEAHRTNEEVEAAIDLVVYGEMHELSRPYTSIDGHLWAASGLDLADEVDATHAERSGMLLFENDDLLAGPDAAEAEVTTTDDDRSSRRPRELFFSTRDGTDPNANGRTYRVLVASSSS